MIALDEIPAAWGKRHFKRPTAATLKNLPLREEDRNILRTVGLPVGPERALTLNFRWFEGQVVHTPQTLRLLFPPDAKKPAHYPRTGNKSLDRWVDLASFVVLGEVQGANYISGRSEISTLAMVCLDAASGRVVVYYHTDVQPAGSVIEVFGSDLAGYLRSWLAFKQWQDAAEDEEQRINRERMMKLRAVYDRLGTVLREADPAGFAVKTIGLWEHRSRNLREELELDEYGDDE